MTNAEYEKLCVDSARKTTKEVAAEAVKNLDEKIKDAEKALQHLQEARRELVNRYDLNKGCRHHWVLSGEDDFLECTKCGEIA
ncbi:MAG: hypothetical protein RSC43_00630 [Clostridia bacterium]